MPRLGSVLRAPPASISYARNRHGTSPGRPPRSRNQRRPIADPWRVAWSMIWWIVTISQSPLAPSPPPSPFYLSGLHGPILSAYWSHV